MEYRQLGRSGATVSSICLGCMNFGSKTGENDSIKIIHAAIDSGINFIDTADVYTKGVSEEITGKALKNGLLRNEIVLATKFTTPMGEKPNRSGSSRYYLVRAVEDSLRRLATDRIDLYQVHYMDMLTQPDELVRAIDDLVRQGKVVYTGTSKFAPSLLTECLMYARQHGLNGFISEQPPYNLLDRRIENELVWACIRHGVGIIPWAPIGAGILSGKYGLEETPPEGSRFTDLGGNRLNADAVRIANELKPLAAEKGVTLAEYCLAWVLRQPGITAPIIGPRTMEQLKSSLKALDIAFTDEEYKRIDEISPPGSAVSDYYDGNVYAKLRRAVKIG